MGWAVVKTTPCPMCSGTGKVTSKFLNVEPENQVTISCFDCKGRGTLFALDDAVPVEKASLRDDDDNGFDVTVECWVER